MSETSATEKIQAIETHKFKSHQYRTVREDPVPSMKRVAHNEPSGNCQLILPTTHYLGASVHPPASTTPETELVRSTCKVEEAVHQAIAWQHAQDPTRQPYIGLSRQYRGRCRPQKLLKVHPPRLCTLFNSQRFKKHFPSSDSEPSHRFLSVMTRGSGSPFPSLQIVCSDQCSSLAAVTQAESLYCPKSSPLYKCMGVEHLCGCQHGLFLHKSYTHIVLLGLGSFGCVHPGGSLVLSSVTRGDKATASQGPHVHFPVELLHACLSRMTFAK